MRAHEIGKAADLQRDQLAHAEACGGGRDVIWCCEGGEAAAGGMVVVGTHLPATVTQFWRLLTSWLTQTSITAPQLALAVTHPPLETPSSSAAMELDLHRIDLLQTSAAAGGTLLARVLGRSSSIAAASPMPQAAISC